jgi:hypothetical protein
MTGPSGNILNSSANSSFDINNCFSFNNEDGSGYYIIGSEGITNSYMKIHES